MKIVRLEAENVKRLRAVHITAGPDGLVIIRGNNGQGKTSVLDAIAYALGGKSLQPPKVIREGEAEARVLLELDDLVVERRWTSNERSTLEVRSKAGAKFPSPQAMLDKLVGRLSFDPLAFMRMDAKAQAEALRNLVGIDTDAMDRKRAEVFACRTTVNAEGKALRARYDAMPVDPDAPAALVSVAELLAEQKRRLELKAEADRARMATAEKERALRAAQDARDRAAVALAEAERGVKKAQAEAELAVAAYNDAVEPDLEDIAAQLRNAEAINEKVRRAKQRAELGEQLEAKRLASAALTETLDALEKEKAAALAAVKFPVDGLGFGELGVTLNGMPLEQASSAEQLRVSLGMGLALNPELKVLLIRDGSLLDAHSLQLVAQQAEAADAQVWLEVVGAEGVGVVIEDGAVAGAPQMPEKAARKKATR